MHNGRVSTPAVTFVGRSSELGEIEGLLVRAAESKTGGFVLVSGEPGMGKTALAEQAVVRARRLRFDVAWSACWQTGVAPPLQPWVEVIESLASDGAEAPDLSRVGTDIDTGRVAQGDAVRRWLQRRGPTPVLIVLDDLQWADSATLSVLAQLAGAVRGLPVVLFGNHRPLSQDPELGARGELRALLRQALVLELRGLDDSELDQLVTSTIGRALTPAAARSLLTLTGGNPLFVRELGRLAADGLDLSAPAVPPSIRVIVDERLAHLDPDARHLVELLAVQGDKADTELMANLVDLSPTQLLDALDGPRRLGLARSDGAAVAFTHDLFRMAVYESLPLATRLTWHERTARGLLSRRDRGLAVPASALAHHFGRAAPLGHRVDAARFALEAAADAVAALAFDVAVRRYEQVLALLDVEPGLADRLSVLADLADARLAAGDAGGARSAFRQAAELAGQTGDAGGLARAALGLSGGLGGIEVTVRDPEAISLLRQASTMLSGDEALRARVEARLSVALSHTGTMAERTSLAERAMAQADSSADLVARAEARAAWCDAHAGPAHLKQRREMAASIIDLAAEAHDSRAEALGRRLLVEAHFESGDLAAVQAEAARYTIMAARLGRAEYGWYPTLWQAAVAMARGDHETRRRLRIQLDALSRSSSSPNAELMVLVQDAMVALELADADLASVFLDQAANLASTIDNSQMAISVARFHLLAGNHEQAAHLIDQSFEAALTAPPDSEWPAAMMQAAEVMIGLGGHTEVGRLRSALEPYADVWVVEGLGALVRGPLHRSLGGLAAVAGDRTAAQHHFEAARRAASRSGASGIEAVVDHEAGLLLGDRSRLAGPARLWQAIGAHHRLAELETWLSGSRAGSDRPVQGPTPGAGSPNRFAAQGGGLWTITFGEVTSSLADRKGLSDLARLLSQPHRELAALDLMAPGGTLVASDMGEVIDADAREAYRARLRDLADELDRADRLGDVSRSARLTTERDALVAQLVGSAGLGGRSRRSGGGSAERARTAVRSRIRDALDRIAQVDPELGRHLRRSIRTGTYCVYDPDPDVVWEVEPPTHTV